MLKRLSAALLFLVMAILSYGQPKPAAGQSEFQKLQADYNSAVQDYYKPLMSAKNEEEASKIKLDPQKNPNPLFLPKFLKLANDLGAGDDAFQAWMMVKQVAEQSGNNAEADHAADVILAKFIDSPKIAQFASMLPYSSWNLPPAEREKKLGGMLQQIEKKAKSDDVKAAALYSRAQLIGRDGQGDAVASAKLYREVIAKYPASAQAKRAKNDVFEMENLVPGKKAPDFVAQDQDGKSFKLSDYRGKVVVLDFWGFW